jgi:hypothetical protein
MSRSSSATSPLDHRVERVRHDDRYSGENSGNVSKQARQVPGRHVLSQGRHLRCQDGREHLEGESPDRVAAASRKSATHWVGSVTMGAGDPRPA